MNSHARRMMVYAWEFRSRDVECINANREIFDGNIDQG